MAARRPAGSAAPAVDGLALVPITEKTFDVALRATLRTCAVCHPFTTIPSEAPTGCALHQSVKLLSTAIVINAEAAVFPGGVVSVLMNATLPVGTVVNRSGSGSHIHDAEANPLLENASRFSRIGPVCCVTSRTCQH
jgi:hypothetical protein